MRGVVGSWVVSLLFWVVVLVFPSPVEVLGSWLLPSARFVFGDRIRSLAEHVWFFPSPVGVLVSWLQPSAWFCFFGDRLRSLAEDGLL